MTNEDVEAYYALVRSYPLLTREQERELLREYQTNPSDRLRNRLVESNLRLVLTIVNHFRRVSRFNDSMALDLIQEGNAGLVYASHKFDPSQGAKFSTYAGLWIRQRILLYILENKHTMRWGNNALSHRLFWGYNKAWHMLERLYSTDSGQILRGLARWFQMPVKQVIEYQQYLRPLVDFGSLSADADTFSVNRHLVRIVEGHEVESPEDLLHLQQVYRSVHQFTEYLRECCLSDIEMAILKHRIMACSSVQKTLKDLGMEFGISRERVRQIEKRLLKRRILMFWQSFCEERGVKIE